MCYVGPLSGAIITSILWKRTKSLRMFWLNLLFWGGALFGVIDHLLNGELFLISEDVFRDLLIGGVITGAILAAWGGVLYLIRKRPELLKTLSS